MSKNEEAYNEICYYTLSLGDPSFIHQHVVDAFAAQNASEDDKPIGLLFALVGLYLHIERGFTGRQVQLAHMKLGQKKEQWPTFSVPSTRGEIDAVQVLATEPGPERNQRIHDWSLSVWNAFSGCHGQVEAFLRERDII